MRPLEYLALSLDSAGNLIEFYANEESGSWSILYRFSGQDMACAMSAGEGWEFPEQLAATPGDDS